MSDYLVIYDGRCNLCSNLVQALERLDQGQRFQYLPMQSPEIQRWEITPERCEQGMILISLRDPIQRWQGSEAAEEISRLFPVGRDLIAAYRALPGLKTVGDRIYAWIRDNRYSLFGQRSQLYTSSQPPACEGTCVGLIQKSSNSG
jgi:predicted DCC family thiol-disulfide oxidoreductase YuxK